MITIEALAKVPIFEGLSDSQLEQITNRCREEAHLAGSFVCKEGDPAEALYIIQDGKIALEMGIRVWPVQRVRQVVIESLAPGEVFGLSGVTDPHTLTMSARAIETSKLIVLSIHDLRRLVEQDRDIGYRVASGLANLVAGRLEETRRKLTESLGESQVAREEAPEESTAIRRIQYGINFRWFAVIGIVVTALFANAALGIRFPVYPVLIIAAVIALYNAVLWRYSQLLDAEEPAAVVPRLTRYIWVQSAADMLAATAIIHFAGGAENPFILYFVLHIILVSLVLPRRDAYLLATLAVGLVGSLVSLEYVQILPHVHLEGFVPPDLHLQGPFVLAVLFGFGTTMYLSTYLTATIAGELRTRHRETVVQRDRLLLEALLEAEDLQRANQELVRLDRLKTYFLAMASHDLKAPLVAVQSYLQVMLGGFVGEPSEQHRRMMERSTQRIRQLFDLINRLLDLAQIEKGKVVEEMEMMSLRDVLNYCVEDMRVLAADKSLELTTDVPADLPMIYGSANHLRELVANLLSNGVKFTPEGGSITVQARDMDKHVEVAVMDTGPGIAPDDLPYLFDEFYRGKGVGPAKGTGLGLYIARRIVEAHEGEIWAESPYAEGQPGARFVFTLPKSPPAETEPSGT
jgi:signal transduction histidine kinase/CRP-like cAMP-binding protein